jgi:twinkle protein
MAKALDCKYVILDHLSIVVSGQDNSDERKAIDEIMTKLRTLVAETGIGLFLVSHLKRVTGKAHEDGGSISLQDLRGSQTIAQLSDIVIGMERNQQHEDPLVRNTTCHRILKNRYTGQTAPACWLRYDVDTGRMTEVPAPSFDDKEVEF